MDGSCYRASTMSKPSSEARRNRRRPTNRSRRSSAEQSSHSSGVGFLGSMSHSILGRSIVISELLDDAPPPPPTTNTWTAAERASIVSEDARLKSLLELEVERAGVVTAAGYRAVHQKFLYGEEVEWALRRAEELRCRPRLPSRKRSSRFGSLVSSLGAASVTASMNMGASVIESNSSQTLPKKLSSGSGPSSESPGHDSGSNIAPRRSSKVDDLTRSQQQTLMQETQDYNEEERRKLMMDSFLASLDHVDDDHEYYSQDVIASKPVSKCPSSATYRRRASNESLGLEDVFDGAEGSQRLRSSLQNSEELRKKPHRPSNATCTTYTRMDTLSSNFQDINFDPDTGGEDREASLKKSYTDACGWLPWPEPKGDDSSSVSCASKELLESFQSSDGDDPYLPWPKNQHRARAA